MSDVIHMPSGGCPALPRGRLIFSCDAQQEAVHPPGASLVSYKCRCSAKRRRSANSTCSSCFLAATDAAPPNGRRAASSWRTDGGIDRDPGMTQIGSVLRHVLREHEKEPVQALTIIGDAFEEEIDPLSGLASELGAAGVPIFAFQEGRDPTALRAFRLLALRSGGQYFEFNAETTQAIDRLTKQLNAVARFAVTGDASVLAIAANVVK